MLLNTFKSLHINLSAGELDIGWIILFVKQNQRVTITLSWWEGDTVLALSVLPSIQLHFQFHTISQQLQTELNKTLYNNNLSPVTGADGIFGSREGLFMKYRGSAEVLQKQRGGLFMQYRHSAYHF